MIWEIHWSGPGLKDLHRLDPQIQARVLHALRRLAETGQAISSACRGHGTSFVSAWATGA